MDIDPLDTSQGHQGSSPGSISQGTGTNSPPCMIGLANNVPAGTWAGGLYNGFSPRFAQAQGQGQGQPQSPEPRARSRSSTSSIAAQGAMQMQGNRGGEAGNGNGNGKGNADGEGSGGVARRSIAPQQYPVSSYSRAQPDHIQPRRTSYGNLHTPPSPRDSFRPEHTAVSASPSKGGKVTVSGFAPLGNPLILTDRTSALPAFRSNVAPNGERRSSLAQSLRLHNISPMSPMENGDPYFPHLGSASSLPSGYISPAPLTLDAVELDRASASTSAPPSPSAASILHPPTFIHTHHPRRGSLVPLNLNLISPIPPSPHIQEAVRRESSAYSMMSPIGPGTPGSISGVPKWTPRELTANSFARRRSLTPSMATLALASPTRLLATGSIGKAVTPGQSDLLANRSLSPNRPRRQSRPSVSAEGWGGGPAVSFGQKKLGQSGVLKQEAHGRRASQPVVSEGAPLAANAMRRRPSSDKDLLYNTKPPTTALLSASAADPGTGMDQEGFKFGGGGVDRGSISSARYSPTTSASGASSTAESEAAEAECQRLAFLRSGFGQGPRLSVGAGRRQSHLREEFGVGGTRTDTIRRDSFGLASYAGLGIGSTLAAPALVGEEVARGGDGRRGSVPIAIPYDKRSRETTSASSASIAEDDDDDDEGQLSRDRSQVSQRLPANMLSGLMSRALVNEQVARLPRAERMDSGTPTITGRRSTLQRPLPPLMPLSDPGRDMLASTLALHRAGHMLESRNLRSEPMPHPLPPSLHPPAPVDLSDFDIDFIFQGAVDPSGIDDADQFPRSDSPNRTAMQQSMALSMPQMRTTNSGGGAEDEDTFAKFVGAFDDEYDDRRGEWTFRACAAQGVEGAVPAVVDAAGIYWDSRGAGKYLVTPKGEVVCQTSGRAWRLRRVGGREFEMEDVTAEYNGQPATNSSNPQVASSLLTPPADGLILATKGNHVDMGGLKVLLGNRKSGRAVGRPRIESEDSAITAKISDLPASTFFGATRLPKADAATLRAGVARRAGSMELPAELLQVKRGRGDKVSFLDARRKSKSQETVASPPRESGSRDIATTREDRKKDRSTTIGDKIKRSWLGSLSKPAHSGIHSDDKRHRRQEKEKTLQSQSWSGGSSSGSIYSQSSSNAHQSVNPSFASKSSYQINSSVEPAYQPPWLLLSDGTQAAAGGRAGDAERGRNHSESGLSSTKAVKGLGIEDETNSGLGWKEGRGWRIVPPEALAMVIPLTRQPPQTYVTVEGEQSGPRPRTADSLGLGNSIALLVYYVPFVSSERDIVKFAPSGAGGQRDKDGEAQSGKAQSTPPLPFRSFRIVGSIVCSSDLRSEPELPAWPEWETPDLDEHSDSPNFSPTPSEPVEGSPRGSPPSTLADFTPSVIAVCHSRGQGVEFVLEGLDRLGLCQGKSAWGPAGYEEWRGSGLSPEGRDVLDVIWSGCVAVLGLLGPGASVG